LGENGAWANPGTPQIFEVPPIISGMDKATNVKFGRYIHRVHPNKSQLKIWEKMERGRVTKVTKAIKFFILFVRPRKQIVKLFPSWNSIPELVQN